MQEIPIPSRLRARPRKGGLPVPFINHCPPGQEPDFRTIDTAQVVLCANRNLCGLCGQKLGREVLLIGSDEEIERREFNDPPMHEECALYAAKACPFLANPHRQYSKLLPKHLPKGQDVVPLRDEEGRPASRIGIVYSPGAVAKSEGPRVWFTVYQITRIDWDTIPNGDTPCPASPGTTESESAAPTRPSAPSAARTPT